MTQTPSPSDAPPPAGRPQKTSVLAVTSMIFGILSMPSCTCFGVGGVVMGVVAVALWAVSRSKLSTHEYDNSSRTMATVGLVTGVIGLLAGLAYMLVFGLAIFSTHQMEQGRQQRLQQFPSAAPRVQPYVTQTTADAPTNLLLPGHELG